VRITHDYDRATHDDVDDDFDHDDDGVPRRGWRRLGRG
jgi:hypothetical protein